MLTVGSFDAADTEKWLPIATSMATESLDLDAFIEGLENLGTSLDDAKALYEAVQDIKKNGPARYPEGWRNEGVCTVAEILKGEPLDRESPWNLDARYGDSIAFCDHTGMSRTSVPVPTSWLRNFMSCEVNRSSLPILAPDPEGFLPKGLCALKRTKRQLTVCKWLYGEQFSEKHYQTLRRHCKGLHDWVIERAKVVAICNLWTTVKGNRSPEHLGALRYSYVDWVKYLDAAARVRTARQKELQMTSTEVKTREVKRAEMLALMETMARELRNLRLEREGTSVV